MSRAVTYAETDSGRNSKTSLVYDPKTGTWSPATSTSSSDTGSKESQKTPPKTSTPNTGAESPPNTDSRTKAEKQYIEAEFNILTGELNITPTERSIRIKVNDTVKIEGLGKYLSGLYFVSAITRTLNKDSGYTHSLSLIKNGFGSSVKKAQKEESTTRKEEVSKEAPELKVNDSVKIVGDGAVYSNTHDGVKVPAWVKKKTLTIKQFSGDNTRVLLMPINSWTYIKYVQKV